MPITKNISNGSQRVTHLNLLTNNYANFKKEIAEETAELQDADGNTMSPEEIAKFLTTLP
jgi:hypothetical protein